MTTLTRTSKFSPWPVAAWAAIALATTLFAPVRDAQASDVVMLDKAPTVNELTDMMFPVRYRSVVLKNGATTAPAPAPKPSVVGYRVQFKYDSTHVLPDSIEFLDTVGAMLRQNGMEDKGLVIEGHTDATGPDTYNQQLSEQRALAVRNYLVQAYGIDSTRLVVVGKGESDLFDVSKPESGANRRVQFRALP